MLPKQDIEHDSINLVVGTVVGHNANCRTRLAVAINPAFPLLVPCRIPGQVVVENGVERILQIDTFAQAIGAHQDPSRSLCKFLYPDLAVVRCKQTGHCFHRSAFGKFHP